MKLQCARITNFRRLDEIFFDLDDRETIFVGPNNSGKTSATSVFRCFLGRRDFTVHDFPLKTLKAMDDWSPEEQDADGNSLDFPEIGLDLWFSLDPGSVAYARIGALVSRLNDEIVEVGVGCVFRANDPETLWGDYTKIYPVNDAGHRKRSLTQFLEADKRLKKYFSIAYYALEKKGDAVERVGLMPQEGKRTLQSLLRVDFVDAQRNLQDDELTSRGSRLSSAFASFYRANLEQAEAGEDAVRIVEEHNERLTRHYDVNFKELMSVLEKLGVPSATERRLTIISALGAQEALKGTTDLVYTEAGAEHSLPEAYNGLGFKNLVLMAVQLRDFQVQWSMTEEDRPLCHVIFIEEPEVHLHAQVQQTFISNMWSILDDLAEKEKITPQLVLTTHSSHILNSVDFEKVRYFRRRRRAGEQAKNQPVLSISEVHSLKEFKAPAVTAKTNTLSEQEALDFLKRYMTLTHCDLLFADAAVLIEGSAERLLLPAMINMKHPELKRAYLTILEVGGAYAHIFSELLKFLHIPYLVITDLDSVKANSVTGRKEACCAADGEAETSNAVLRSYFPGQSAIAALIALTPTERIQEDGNRFVTYQRPVEVQHADQKLSLWARTFEEALIYENLPACGEGGFLSGINLPTVPGDINRSVFEQVRAPSFKKTDFALGVLSQMVWSPPIYVLEGLAWLVDRLKVTKDAGDDDGT